MLLFFFFAAGTRVELCKISLGAFDEGLRRQSDADTELVHLGKRWSSSLKEQLAWSLAVADAEPAEVLPRWSCRLESGQAVEQFCERMTSMCSAQIVQVHEVDHPARP